MKLRGHHLFCTALFSGHGYDESFTKAMTAAVEVLQNGEPIELVSGPDGLCAACPNRMKGGGCALGTDDVLCRDRAAFQVLGLAAGESLSWRQAGKLLSQVTERDFQTVCGNCRWQKEGLCSQKLLRERTVFR